MKLCIVSWIYLLQNDVNVLHLTRIMSHSQHHLVKLEMLITQVLPLRCQRKKLQNLSHLNCDLKFARFESSWLQHVVSIAREGVQNTHWSGRTEAATENGVGQAGSRRHCNSHSSMESSIASDQWCVFRTPSLAILPVHTLLLTGFKSGEFGGHSWDRVSFCNNSMVARSQWAFQFSQGSVRGGIFRWGGKCLNHFEANLFRKLSIKYRQNRRV